MDTAKKIWDSAKELLTGQPPPTVDADDGSVVTTRQLTNIKAPSINMKVEAENNAGTGPSETVDGQLPPAHYTARGGSVVCADKMSDITVDGDLNLSVSAKASKHT